MTIFKFKKITLLFLTLTISATFCACEAKTSQPTISETTISDTSSTDEPEARRVSDEYCDMLKMKQSNIVSITYISGTKVFEEYNYKYQLNYNEGTVRIGTVNVTKSSGSFSVTGMDLD